VTTQLVQELIREHLQANLGGHFAEDSNQDLTGLRRAAAFFERQSQMNDIAGYGNEEAAPEKQSSSDWLEIVTEEQVSALIHEVWRESEKSNAAIVSTAQDDGPAEGLDDEVVLVNDSAAQVIIDGSTGHVATIADKAIQVECDEGKCKLQPSNAGPDKQINETRLAQTHLGRLIQGAVPDVQVPGATVSDALRQLRRLRLDQQVQQRRGVSHQIRCSVASDEQREFGDEGSRVASISSASTGVKSPRDSLQGSTAGDNENCSPSNIPDGAHEERETSERRTPEPMDSRTQPAEMQPLGEKRLMSFDLPRESWSSSGARSSSSRSSYAMSSDPLSSSVENSHVFNAMDERVRRVNAQRRHIRAPTRSCWSNGNLSEGEVNPDDPGNTSEGEIIGRRREKYTSLLNSSRQHFYQRPARHQSSSEGLYSSVESGELHAHVISSLSSSRESGELHKVRPILSQRNAKRST
jgi:hypothetical protein